MMTIKTQTRQQTTNSLRKVHFNVFKCNLNNSRSILITAYNWQHIAPMSKLVTARWNIKCSYMCVHGSVIEDARVRYGGHKSLSR